MPKETQIEIIYDELKKYIGEKYENMKGFKIAPMREIDIVDYLEMYFFHNVDNISTVSDIITSFELVPFLNDLQIQLMFQKIKELRK